MKSLSGSLKQMGANKRIAQSYTKHHFDKYKRLLSKNRKTGF